MKNIIEALKVEASRMEQQLATIGNAIAVLGGGSPNTGNGRKHGNGRRKKFSAAARKRMSLAAKARWAAKAKAAAK